MQSPSIQDLPPNSKRRLELQNQYNAQLQQQQQQQQQQNCDDMICINEEPPFKKQRPGVATNFLYKLTEFAAYTSTIASIASEAINTITGGQGGRESNRQSYDYDDVLQIRTDDEDDDENDLYDHKLDKKDESAWAENDDEEEPPPPYDSSWSMPSLSTTHVKIPEMESLTTPVLSFSPSQQEFSTPQQPSTSQKIVPKSTINTTPRRRQFRVRRGRRFIRRKSSSVDMSNIINTSSTITQPENDEEEDIFLKFNCKLADMIAEGRAALTSTVDVTDVEMMIAEEKEREERIMKEFGIQTPISRRARRLTSSSTSSDYDYYSSILGTGGHSNQSSTSICDNGFSGGLTGYSSPTGYSVDNVFSTNRPTIGRSSPTQYGVPGVFNFSNESSNGYGHGYLSGSPSTGSPTTGGYEGSNIGQYSSGYGSNSGFGSNWVCNGRNYY